MTYDVAEGSTILFGGCNFSGVFFNDTWTWKKGWVQQFPANSPPARFLSAMAYDPTTGTIVLFGGNINGSNEDLNDTWTWDGVNWTQQFPPVSPAARDTAGMTFDEATGKIVLFGGAPNATGDGQVFNDTWVWDGTAKTWTELFPATSPSPRRNRIAYDGVTRNVVLFGGDNGQYGCCDTYYDDTWTWDGRNWTQQFPASSPTGRTENSLTYDLETRRVFLFVGYLNGSGLGDTWIWNGTTWEQIQTASAPHPRWAQAADFDPNSRAVVLFGGSLFSGGDAANDTWFLVYRP